jgi:hypothetical protein
MYKLHTTVNEYRHILHQTFLSQCFLSWLQSEYVASHDLRRGYISGFTGSAGDAVVTLHSAALWTDSRYYLQAENQLDCNWVLMKSGYSEVNTNMFVLLYFDLLLTV